MLDLKFVRDNIDQVRSALQQRRQKIDLEQFIAFEQQRRDILQEAESLKHDRNIYSQKVAEIRQKGTAVENGNLIRMKNISQRIKVLDEELKIVIAKMESILHTIPNMPHQSVPFGEGEKDNPVVRSWGKIREFLFNPKPHWDLGESLDILDFQRSVKITGARFTLYKGMGALLERALINFMLDLHTKKHGYTEVIPPFMVNATSMFSTGQLPKFEEDLFKISSDDFYLIPTAEVPVTNIHRDEILAESQLPIKYVAYTPCFRREAGSYGKDTRGLIRQHQFNKVELVWFSHPDNSYSNLELLLHDAEEVLQYLELPYRIVNLCTGDLGFSAAKTYDIEVWIPSQQTYREISSCSNFGDFQARRAKIRYRKKNSEKTDLVHTLNGSGLAIGRTVVAILENYQEEDGSISIPAVLQEYFSGKTNILK